MPPRAYHSPRRAAAAAATRGHILDVAAATLVARGYANTTVTAIAQAAEVTPATVYASVGGKPALALALLERSVDHREVGETLTDLERISDPADLIGRVVAGILRVQGTVFALIAALEEAARSEPVVADAVRNSERLARQRFRMLVDRLGTLGGLAPSMTPERATDVLWFYLGYPSWASLARLGWPVAEIEDFLRRQLVHSLIEQAMER
jgi:AcrR family transcriptional regulator